MILALKWIGVSIVVLFAVACGFLASEYPESFQGISLAAFWGLVLSLILYHIGQRSLGETWLRRVIVAGLLIRAPIVLAHLAIGFLIYRGQLDFPGYFASSVSYGRSLLQGELDFFFNLTRPEDIVLRLSALTYFMIGSSVVGMFLVSGIIGFCGSYLFLRAFQEAFPSSRDIRFLAVSLFFFPSLVFWTSLLGKDSWIFFFLALATYAIAHLLKAIRLRYLLGLTASITVITLIRPPLGVALGAAIGVFGILALRSRSRLGTKPAAILRPVGYLVITLIMLGTFTIMFSPLRHYGRLSEDTSLVEALLTVAVAKHSGLSTEGSSLPVRIRDASAFEVVRFLPELMFTFLFRPMVFEAHNVLAFIAGLDGTLLLILVLWRRRYLLGALRSALSRPFVAFCSVVFLLFTAGLSFELNFGVIVRHRSMVLPFLFILLAVPVSAGSEASLPSRYASYGGTSGSAERESGRAD